LLSKEIEKYGKKKGITLKLQAKTRWGGAVITINSLQRNKSALQETFISENLEIDRNVRRCVLGEKFWDGLKCAADLLTPPQLVQETVVAGSKPNLAVTNFVIIL